MNGTASSRPAGRAADLMALATALALFLLNLGAFPLFDFDEGAFAEATREMLQRGDYLSTWLNGHPRFDKPILIYWLQALPVEIFGPVEWAFRLPSALAAAGWSYVTYRFVKQHWGARAGWLALFMVATSLGPEVIGRAATADAVLNFFLALTLVDLWRFLSGELPTVRRATLWVALGILTKGPIALLIPGAALMLWALVNRDARPLWRALADPWAWAILLGVAGPWYAAALALHGRDFIDGFIMKHNVGRFTGTLEGHGGSLWYYVLMVPVLLLPWWAWLAVVLVRLRTLWSEPLPRYLILWAGFVIVFFSLSGTKLPHYALYGATPLWILMASQSERVRRTVPAVLPGLAVLCAFAFLPDMLARLHVTEPYYAAQLARIGSALPTWYETGLMVALVLALALAVVLRRSAPAATASVALIGTLAGVLFVGPFVGDLLQGPIKRAGLVARLAGLSTVVQSDVHYPSFSVYLRHETPLATPEPGEWVLTRRDRLRPGQGTPGSVLFEEGGLVLYRQR